MNKNSKKMDEKRKEDKEELIKKMDKLEETDGWIRIKLIYL